MMHLDSNRQVAALGSVRTSDVLTIPTPTAERPRRRKPIDTANEIVDRTRLDAWAAIAARRRSPLVALTPLTRSAPLSTYCPSAHRCQ